MEEWPFDRGDERMHSFLIFTVGLVTGYTWNQQSNLVVAVPAVSRGLWTPLCKVWLNKLHM